MIHLKQLIQLESQEFLTGQATNTATRICGTRVFDPQVNLLIQKRKHAVNSQFSIVNCFARGFTLVEVLVTLGVFAVITGAVLANYRGYNTNALFANASEDIVLALRQAQVYGVGVKGAGTSFTTPYGVSFQVNTSSITIFADSVNDGVYDSSDDLVIETINWPSNIKIRDVPNDGLLCDSAHPSNLWVTFNRPNPDAVIKRNSGAPVCALGEITIIDSNTNKTAKITITGAGQISLQ